MSDVLEPPDDALQRLVRNAVFAMAPLQVWLFGSRAEGRARPDSDYDILVVVPDDAPNTIFHPVYAWRVGHDVRVPADVIPITRSDFEEEKGEIDTLARAAFLRGRKVYER